MSNVNTLISQRLQKTEGAGNSKMAAMAKRSANGHLSSFSGVFSIAELNNAEKQALEELLHTYSDGKSKIQADLDALISITSEVKAINNQAALLHGERIYNAQKILTRYKEGAFTAWLIQTYGNRQTPYNLLRYYEFHEALPKDLRPQLESMPRQAIYTLATRDGSFQDKLRFVENFEGQTKAELLASIRTLFPLQENDKRDSNLGETLLQHLARVLKTVQTRKKGISKSQKNAILATLEEIHTLISGRS